MTTCAIQVGFFLDYVSWLGITAARLNDIVRERRGITADTALRLARYLGNSPEFWMRLQHDYELRVAKAKGMRAIERAVQPRKENAAA